MSPRPKFTTIGDYIESFPQETKLILEKMRKTIKTVLPEAEETISYGIPTFKINGKYVVYFAGFEKHVSIYPVFAELVKELPELEQYVAGKGTIKFPLDKPIPYDLIKETTKLLMEAHLERNSKKK